MPGNPHKLSQFWQELKRRKVTHVISVYAAAAFVILELTDIVAPSLGLPGWTLNLIIVLLVAGFIIAVILSWIYDVHPEEGIVRTKPVQEVTPKDIPAGSRGWKIASYISFAIIIVLILINVIPGKDKQQNETILDKSIAVLPFTSLSDEPEKQFLADGVMEEILFQLARIRDLRVIGRTSVEQYRKTEKTVTMICQELGVSYVLEGSFRKYGDQARLIVQLIRPGEEGHVWVNEYDREWKEILTVQSEVAQLVADELHAVITPEERERIVRPPTDNIEAYNKYLYGLHLEHEGLSDSLIKAVEFFKEAILLDPRFVEAYIAQADCYGLLAYHGVLKPSDAYHNVEKLARRALELDPLCGRAYDVLAVVDIFYYFNFPGAERNLRKGLELTPHQTSIYAIYAQYYATQGEYNRAIEMHQKAIALDPMYLSGNSRYGFDLYFAGKREEAISYMKNLARNYQMKRYYVGFLFIMEEKYEEAIEETENSERENSPLAITQIGLAYARLGRLDMTVQMLDSLESMAKDQFISYMLRGALLAELGRREEALKYLRKGYEEREELVMMLQHMAPMYYSGMRSDPEFVSIMRKIFPE